MANAYTYINSKLVHANETNLSSPTIAICEISQVNGLKSKINKLDSLGISNISGLQAQLTNITNMLNELDTRITALENNTTPVEPQPDNNYYWYVGTIQPTDPTNSIQNTGLNTWTLIGTELPTSDIKVSKADTNYELHTWYIAAPTDANFTLYNATNVASDEATWNKSTFNVGTIQYTLWTSKDQGWQAAEYLHK